MGRRKIEIKAIKDDRNRSVTFLKRKAGLFKKAHELSVLCSVDVAVIIFGHNKKLYEFSSGDMRETLGRYQYYGSAHEHKGPTDFSGKQNLDDEEEDDVSPEPEEMPPHTQGMVQPSMHNQPTFQHINSTASASPPIANGLSYHARHGTPQPAGISRPSSRNNIQRVNSNLVPQGQHPHSTPPPPQNGYAYMPNPPAMYNAPPNANMGPQPPRPQYQYSHPPPVPQHPPVQPPMPAHPPSHHPQAMQPQHPPQQHTPQPPHQPFPQSQQAYLHEQQRQQSMPPTYSQQEAKPAPTEPSPPQQQGEVKPEDGQSPPPPKPLPSKSRSIFTPIDDRGSVLAQHFGFGPPSESPKTESPAKTEPDSAEATTTSSHAPTLPPPPVPPHASRAPAPPQRTHSLSSMPDIPPISRQNSLQMGAKRPRLKVQIPSENSDAGSGTADSSPRDSGNTAATPAKGSSETGGHSAVVLPPPSPSASALLSAGAQGPPNPFARPPPPAASNSAAYNNNNIDTPISALPSRFVSDTLLPSPSSFYPEWGFGRSGPDSNMLPSPLTFPTPVAHNGPAYPRDAEEAEKKRKSSDENANAPEGSNGKRLRVE